jgi:hypothetical protein
MFSIADSDRLQRNRMKHVESTLVRMVLGGACVAAMLISGAWAQEAGTQPGSAKPVLLELFTSEGCSSCPPADALVQQWAQSQPISGAQLIVLSEHVDYWNHDGWKDPYSSSSITDRQIGYVRAMKLKEPYTPQIIVDGSSELRGDQQQMVQTLEKDAGAPKISLRLDSVSADGKTPPDLKGHIDIEPSPEKHNADVYVAVALAHAESQVASGENSGKHLTHIDVVQEIKKVGKLDKNSHFSQDFQLKLQPGTDSSNVRVVAFVQEPGPGRVLGAALWKPAN